MVKTLLAMTALFLAVSCCARRGDSLVGGDVPAHAVGKLAGVAVDLGPFIDVTLPTGEKLKMVCWEVKHIDAVIWLYDSIDGRIWAFGYWTKAAFQPRATSEGWSKASPITLRPTTVKLDKSPRTSPATSPTRQPQQYTATIFPT